jgi:hypothetical protein
MNDLGKFRLREMHNTGAGAEEAVNVRPPGKGRRYTGSNFHKAEEGEGVADRAQGGGLVVVVGLEKMI